MFFVFVLFCFLFLFCFVFVFKDKVTREGFDESTRDEEANDKTL